MNWQNLIKNLVDSGVSQAEICRQTGISAASVCELASGVQRSVSWERGQALISLASSKNVFGMAGERKEVA